MARKTRSSLGTTIGGILAGFDQQVLKAVPPAYELVHHTRPDAPVPTKDGGLVVRLRSEQRAAKAHEADEADETAETDESAEAHVAGDDHAPPRK
jgi:hypothetical protein